MRSLVRRLAGDESGDIISGWLVRMVVFMGLFALVGYEFVMVGLNYVQTEDAAQEVSRAARRAYRDTRQDEDQAQEAAEVEADAQDVRLVGFEVLEEHVAVEVESTADTLFLDDLGFLDGLTTRSATSTVRWRE